MKSELVGKELHVESRRVLALCVAVVALIASEALAIGVLSAPEALEKWIFDAHSSPNVKASYVTEGWPTIQATEEPRLARRTCDIILSWPHGYKFVEEQFSATVPQGGVPQTLDLPSDVAWTLSQRFALIFRPDASVFSGTPPNLQESASPRALAESANLFCHWLPQLAAGVVRDALNDRSTVTDTNDEILVRIPRYGLRFVFKRHGKTDLQLAEIQRLAADRVIERFEYSDYRPVSGFAVPVAFMRKNWWCRESIDIRTRRSEVDPEPTFQSLTRLTSITAIPAPGADAFDPASDPRLRSTPVTATATAQPSNPSASNPASPSQSPKQPPSRPAPSPRIDPVAAVLAAIGIISIATALLWKIVRRSA
jgi:hypothetical protein